MYKVGLIFLAASLVTFLGTGKLPISENYLSLHRESDIGLSVTETTPVQRTGVTSGPIALFIFRLRRALVVRKYGCQLLGFHKGVIEVMNATCV